MLCDSELGEGGYESWKMRIATVHDRPAHLVDKRESLFILT